MAISRNRSENCAQSKFSAVEDLLPAERGREVGEGGRKVREGGREGGRERVLANWMQVDMYNETCVRDSSR